MRRLWLVATVFALSTVTLQAQLIQDINPDNSTLDRSDPDGGTGGRVNGLAAVPGDNQTFYAASEWGGLFKTGDGGRVWKRLDQHLPVATWDVEVDPTNPQIVYATSFYDGRANSLAGINVSYNAGANWTHSLFTTPPPGLCSETARTEPSAFGISISPNASQNVFIGTNCGLAVSHDFGGSWTFVDPTPSTPASRVWDVVVQSGGVTNPGIVDICGEDGHRRSVDGGVTWTGGGGLPAGRCSIAVSPHESYVLFLVVGTRIFESDNAGVTWTEFTNPSPQGRIPFVATNPRVAGAGVTAFDLWFADVSLWRATCTTPVIPAPGGAPRCPGSSTWAGPFTRTAGAHDDAGDLAFDTEVSIDACPLIFSSDGGVYRNTDLTTDCHNPNWEQPDVTPHALWLFAMHGADLIGDLAEGLYFGTQDNGSFAALNAGAERPTWNNRDCCDVFDIVADSNRVVYTVCCFGGGVSNRLFVRNPGMVGGGEINTYPPGILSGFRAIDLIDRFADKQYVLVTTGGVFVTADITAFPIVWTQLPGSPPGACGVKASVSAATPEAPIFYVQSGSCDGRTGGQLWRYAGVSAGDVWQRVDNNSGLTGGFGIFSVDTKNPNRLYASNLMAATVQMVFSEDGGLTWQRDADLDNLMTGSGVFKYRNLTGPTDFTGFLGYPQPSLIAYDPNASNILVAGGIDAGVFLSTNSGKDWSLLTDPFDSGDSGVPHLPRPRFAYFDHEPTGTVNLFIGTQGRGVWRLSLPIGVSTVVNDELVAKLDTNTFSFDPTPGLQSPAGTFSFISQFCNVGSKRLTGLKSVTQTLSDNHVLLNRDSGTPSGPGSELTFVSNGAYADLILDAGECVDVFYRLGLASSGQFQFFVDVHGTILGAGGSSSP